MTMTDLGVECMVGLCMAAAIWWVARRRCRTHTEEPKTRFESVDPAKAMSLVDDASAAAAEEDALLAEGDTSEQRCDRTTDAQQDDMASLHSQQPASEEEEEDDEVAEDEDDAAETDVTDHDGDDEDDDDDDDDEGEEEDEVQMDDQMKEALARAEAMAAKMGVNAFSNMTESVMAMEEFLVLDAPLLPAQPGTEAERMQMEDPAEAHHAQDEVEDAGEEELDEDDDEDLVNVESVEEKEDDQDEAEPPAAVAATSEGETSGVTSTFWAQCENKDECSLCNTPFSFLVRRHHCRKCRASVCGGCSSNSTALAEFGGSVERVCDRCWATMQMAAADLHHDELEPQDEVKTLSS